MINNKFIYFKTKQSFEENIDQIPVTSIVFVEDTKEIITHNTTYSTGEGGGAGVDVKPIDEETINNLN